LYFLPAAYAIMSDCWWRRGWSVMAPTYAKKRLECFPLPDEIRHELKKSGQSDMDWVTNPVDFSIARSN